MTVEQFELDFKLMKQITDEKIAQKRKEEVCTKARGFLETEFEKYSSKGGDEVRRVLGTVGIESPCFQLEKALKKLALDAEDPETYSEAVEQLMLAISRADGMAYSANFAGGSGKPLPPAVYLEKSRKEVVLVNLQMKNLLAALGPL